MLENDELKDELNSEEELDVSIIDASTKKLDKDLQKKLKNSTNILSVKDELAKKDEMYHNSEEIFGITNLHPGSSSSSRLLMYTGHHKQRRNIIDPESAYIFTNHENLAGKYSSGLKLSKKNYKIVDKVYEYGSAYKGMYYLFLYDEENDKYSVIHRKEVEHITEIYGYRYDNTNIDSKDVGDIIEKGEVIRKTNSYDEYNNYRFGKNVRYTYMFINQTEEDAIVVSRSLANNTKYTDVEIVRVSFNDNDIPTNLYGDDNVYKGFPDLGEFTKGKILTAKKRLFNKQVLFDTKTTNLKNINLTSDKIEYLEGSQAQVVGIQVFSNKDEEDMEENEFNSQIYKYYNIQKDTNQTLKHVTDRIIASGSKYSKDIGFINRKVTNMLNPEYKWITDDGGVFGNIVIEFTLVRDVPLSKGQKLTGRYGNKGVIAAIWDDDDMPHLANGKRVDMILNASGVVGRVNPFQLNEQKITSICEQVCEHLIGKDDQAKIDTICDIINRFNPDQYKAFKGYLDSVPRPIDVINNIIDEGMIYIHIHPFWEKGEPIFDIIRGILRDYPFIQQQDVFIKRRGKWKKIMRKMTVGYMYMMVLKQSGSKQFSARANGNISLKRLPEKTSAKEIFSKTPVRLGIDETLNYLIGSNPDVLALMHLYYRSSELARRDLAKRLLLNKDLEEFGVSDKFVNMNALILEALLKTLGLRIEFEADETIEILTGEPVEIRHNGEIKKMTDVEFKDLMDLEEIEKELAEGKAYIGTPEGYKDLIYKLLDERRSRAKRKEFIEIRD